MGRLSSHGKSGCSGDREAGDELVEHSAAGVPCKRVLEEGAEA